MITNLKNETTSETIYPNIVSDNIPSGAINASKLATGAVTRDKIATASIDASKLDSQSVTADKVAPNAIDGQCIQTNAIDSSHIRANAVTFAKMNFVRSSLASSVGSSDFQALYTLFVDVVTNPGYMKIYFEDTGEYSPLQIVMMDPGRIIFDMKGTTTTIGSDADATTFITGYGSNIFISRLA